LHPATGKCRFFFCFFFVATHLGSARKFRSEMDVTLREYESSSSMSRTRRWHAADS
jgi:hypothetical protein